MITPTQLAEIRKTIKDSGTMSRVSMNEWIEEFA